MKKLIAIALVLAMALSLCACGKTERYPDLADMLDAGDYEGAVMYIYDLYEQAQAGGEGEGEGGEGEGEGEGGGDVVHTEPPRPTEEEWTVLNSYSNIVYSLTSYVNSEDHYISYWDDEADTSYSGSAALAHYYEKLQALDTAVIDKWKDTEYCGTDYFSGYNSEGVNWDYASVLAGFSKLDNVLLKEVHTTLDNMENVSTSYSQPTWYYNEDGSVREIYNEDDAFSLTETNPWGLYGTKDCTYDDSGKVTKIKYMSGDTTNYIVDLTYDSNGNVINEHIKQNSGEVDITYAYDSQNRLVKIEHPYSIDSTTLITYTYTYDDNGNMVKCEKSQHYTDTWYNTGKDLVEYKNIWEYTYDANGALVSGFYKWQDWDYNSDWHWETDTYTLETYVYREKVDQYTFTSDDQGRPLTMVTTYGDTVYCHGDNAGQVYGEPSYVSMTVEFVYGDYYFYSIAE